MPSAHEIAADLLRTFGANVVARRPPRTYGEYAADIGRAPAAYGLAVGKAMHAIGALCVVRKLPVAPLFWVRRADNGYRGVFESDPLERQRVLASGDIDTMYVVAREYQYSAKDFAGLEKALRESLARGGVSQWSPHELWHLTFVKHRSGSEETYYEVAMNHYRQLFGDIKSARSHK